MRLHSLSLVRGSAIKTSLVQVSIGAAMLAAALPAGALAMVGLETERQPAAAAAQRDVRVVVTIAPLRGLVEPMLSAAGLSGATVDVLIPPGVSEHGYEIPPAKLASAARADVVVMIGLGLEPQVEKMFKDRTRPGQRVLVLADELGIQAVAGGHDCGVDHGPGETCEGHGKDHAGHKHAADPHVWLDPVLVEKCVSKIAEALREASGNSPETHTAIWKAEEELLERVRATHGRYQRTLSSAERRTLVVGHDAWGYLARRYELTTVAIKGLTASEPTPDSLAAATNAIRHEGARAVFVEPQLSKKAGERIAKSTGVPLLQLDPLGDGDWFKMMDTNLAAIAKGLGVEVRDGTPTQAPGVQAQPASAIK
jgi:zinc transport system substrate-binding protein